MGFLANTFGLRKFSQLSKKSGKSKLSSKLSKFLPDRKTACQVNAQSPESSPILAALVGKALERPASTLVTHRTVTGIFCSRPGANDPLQSAVTSNDNELNCILEDWSHSKSSDSALDIVATNGGLDEQEESHEESPGCFVHDTDNMTNINLIATINDELPDEDLFENQQAHPSSDFSSSSGESGSEAVDARGSRSDWGPIRELSNILFRRALLEHLPEDHGVTTDDIEDISACEGGFNFVRIMQLYNGPYADRYVVKVPCTGTVARWQEADAYMWRNEARTMQYIRDHTKVPLPEILGFSDTLSNVLGAPYIVMRAVNGVPSNRIWFDRDEDGTDDLDSAFRPSAARLKKRTTFLQSLAEAMSSLQTLTFDKTGMLNFDDDSHTPTIGPVYMWKSIEELAQLKEQDMSTSASITCIPPFSSSEEYFKTAMAEVLPWNDEGKSPEADEDNGRCFIMDTVLSSEPFSFSAKVGDSQESFVLRHDDLDFQNILCDPLGNVTAILDWDKCRAVPRCFGYSSVPTFLTLDWCPDFWHTDVHMPWELDQYRQCYADAMLKATGPTGDGKYTIKSHMYEAINASLYGGNSGGSTKDVVNKIMRELPCARKFPVTTVLGLLGGVWEQGEEQAYKEVLELMNPSAAPC